MNTVLNIMFSNDNSLLRKQLLKTMIKGDTLKTSDVRRLFKLAFHKLGPKKNINQKLRSFLQQ